MQLLLGLTEPISGGAQVLGFDSVRQSQEVRECSGVLPEHHRLYGRLTAEDNLEFQGRTYGIVTAGRKVRIREPLEPLDLWERRNLRAGNRSGAGSRSPLWCACHWPVQHSRF